MASVLHELLQSSYLWNNFQFSENSISIMEELYWKDTKESLSLPSHLANSDIWIRIDYFNKYSLGDLKKLILFLNSLFPQIDFRQREGEREERRERKKERGRKGGKGRERFVVLFIYVFIAWFLYVSCWGIEPATLAYWDDVLINLTTRPGTFSQFLIMTKSNLFL